MYIAKAPGSTPCQSYEEELWFSKPNSQRTAKAKQLCGLCEERADCLISVLRYERKMGRISPGTYAGLTDTERAELLNLKGEFRGKKTA